MLDIHAQQPQTLTILELYMMYAMMNTKNKDSKCVIQETSSSTETRKIKRYIFMFPIINHVSTEWRLPVAGLGSSWIIFT